MKRIAVLSASGFGDALLMMIAAHQLALSGHTVELFHPNPKQIAPLFDTSVIFSAYPCDPKNYDLIILENDNSKIAYDFFELRARGEMEHLRVLFHKPSIMQQVGDIVFDQNESVATNIQMALFTWLKSPSLENGLKDFKTIKPCPYRIAIHPLSQDLKRNWTLSKFISLANGLKNMGYEPVFTLPSNDLPRPLLESGHRVEVFETLEKLASFYTTCSFFIGNDSGPGHLASCLRIPTLTISGNLTHVRKWRPGFYDNEIVTPFLPIPNFKGLNMAFRDKYWQHFISPSRVLKSFYTLIKDR
jgi:heptosyltransferase-3